LRASVRHTDACSQGRARLGGLRRLRRLTHPAFLRSSGVQPVRRFAVPIACTGYTGIPGADRLRAKNGPGETRYQPHNRARPQCRIIR